MFEPGSDAPPSENDLPAHVAADTAVGRLLLPADDQVVTPHIAALGSWEPAETAAMVALLRPGGRVIDVGAHVGYMTALAAARVGPTGRVLAVEAHPANFAFLCANLAALGVNQACALRAGAWNETGDTLTMTASAENSGDHRVYRHGTDRETLDVASVALDDVLDPASPVDFVKIDVQGTDHLAVEGMRKTISRHRPTLMVEFWPEGIEEMGADPLAALEVYRSLDYELAVLERPLVGTRAPASRVLEEARSLGHGFLTLLLRPR